MSSDVTVRTETDSLGAVEIPLDAYWGIHTSRALTNFPISHRPISIHPDLVRALAIIKQAAARANRDMGVLGETTAAWIDDACGRVRYGEFHGQFVVDIIQGGAGTSTNLNANEVIANIAPEEHGYPKGAYDVLHPIDDVNRSQSTNDVYPSAVKLALCFALKRLVEEHTLLRVAFTAKGEQFTGVLKVGRTRRRRGGQRGRDP